MAQQQQVIMQAQKEKKEAERREKAKEIAHERFKKAKAANTSPSDDSKAQASAAKSPLKQL